MSLCGCTDSTMHQRQQVVPHAGGGALTTFVEGVKNHPKLSSFIVLWILLALSFVYAPAPLVVTPGTVWATFRRRARATVLAPHHASLAPLTRLCGWATAMQQKFEDTLARVPMREIHAAMVERDDAAAYVDEAKVWFWRLRSEYASEVAARQPALDRAQARLDELLAERDAIMLEARQLVGIWSEVGCCRGACDGLPAFAC